MKIELVRNNKLTMLIFQIITDYCMDIEQISNLCALAACKLNNDSTCFASKKLETYN